MTLRNLIAALATLSALAAAAFLALSHAHAGPPPEGVELVLHVDDADGVIEPGQTVKVSAAVRFPGQYGGLEQMKASDFSLTSSLGWDAVTGRTLTFDTFDNPRTIMGLYRLRPKTDDGVRLLGKRLAVLQALDGRTAVSRDQIGNKVHVFDVWNKRQVLTIPPPAGATNGFGCGERGLGSDPGHVCYRARAMAVWHETESLAWLFIGEAEAQGPGGEAKVGRLHIYSLDWTTDPPTLTRHGSMQPTLAEAGNHITRTSNAADYSRYWASYGNSVAISADGSTLAVGAGRINQIGAVYVYTRPDGAGQDWSDIAYEDGVKVTVAPTPHWGQSPATGDAPFSGQTCDAICKTQRNNTWNRFAWRHIGLSADGRVMAVGAGGTSYYHDETNLAPYPSESGGTGKWNTGQAYVFVAPDGGWQAAPDVVTGKTVMTAKANAATAYPDYSRATHITAGPNRRITEPTVILRARAWGSAGNNWRFGEFITITRDGTTIAAGTNSQEVWGGNPDNPGPGRGFIFQVDSPDQWEEIDQPWVHGANPMTGATSAELGGSSGYGAPGWCGMAFNGAGDRLAFGMCGAGGGNDPGEVRYFHRPADGRWATGAVYQLGALFREPGGQHVGNSYGWPLYSLNGERLAVSALGWKVVDHACCTANSSYPGHTYYSDAGCRQHRDAEGRTWTTCPLETNHNDDPMGLGDAATIVVPPGQPEGALTISGQIKVFMYLGISGGYSGPVGDDTENAKTLSKTLTLRIGEVAELAQAQLDFAVEQPGVGGGDDRLFPSSLTAGERTVLRLRLLNEGGMPTPADAIASIIATTTRGSLSSNIRDDDNARISNGCLGGGGDACQIEPTLLSLAGEEGRIFSYPYNTPRPPGSYSADNILLTLAYSGTGGPADVNVRVIAKDGTSLSPETVRVNLIGAPTALSIAEPTAGVLGIGTPDADDESGDVDNRDLLTLPVTATDASGLSVPVPSGNYLARVTGPDGRRVGDGVQIEWPLGGAESPTRTLAGAWQVRVDVDRAAGASLANGEYTLFVRAGRLTAEQTFTVSGAAAALSLSEPSETPALNGQFSVTATVVDAAGDPVPDGTEVDWEARTLVVLGDATTLVQTAADTRTTQGKASSTWLVVGSGNASLRATADGVTELLVVNVPNPAAAAARQPASLIDSLSATTPGAPASWLGATTVMAADLLPALDGVNTLLLWQYGTWLRYAVVDGRVVPGSYNFQVRQGDVLWLTE